METVCQPLRVLMLITNLGQGGAERVFHDHATAFARSGMWVEQAVFAGHYDAAYQNELRMHELCIPRWLRWFGAVGRIIARALALRRIVEVGNFDVVVSHMDGANWVNVLSGSNAKKVLVVHGTVLHDHNQGGWRQWLRIHSLIPYFYNRANATVAVSEGIRRELIDLGVRNVHAIKNFFDLAAISRAASSKLSAEFDGLFSSSDVLITSGRLSVQKNQVELIRLFSSIKSRRSKVRLAILGEGELRYELLTACAAHGLRAWHPWGGLPSADAQVADVWFFGYQKNPFAFMARSRLFLFPSAWEGFPLALCEAMACGVPVLSADCPTGPREIIAPNTDPVPMQASTAEFWPAGVLLPMLDSDASHRAWVNAVSLLLDQASLRRQLVTAGLAAVKQLDQKVILGRWLQLFQSLVGARDRGSCSA